MKILAIADTEEKAFWDYYTPGRLKGYDMILSCGDLDPDYLQFLVTVSGAPLLYVHGNHDGEKYENRPPLGCDCIDGKLVECKGLRILGLGGSMRYRPGENLYTEKEMCRRIRKLRLQLMWKRGFDILVTHAPARGYGDMDDPAHLGFECFNGLLEKWRPSLFLHGHVHREYGEFVREREHPSGARVINAGGHIVIEI